MADTASFAVPDLTPGDPGTAGGLIKSASAGILVSVVRTVVPLLVGYVVAFFALVGVEVSTAQAEQLIQGVVSLGVATLYYVAARLLERFKSTRWGWLLGVPAAPVYMEATAGGSADQVQAALAANVQAN